MSKKEKKEEGEYLSIDFSTKFLVHYIRVMRLTKEELFKISKKADTSLKKAND